MSKNLNEVKIVAILAELTNGANIDELCRLHGVGRSTIYAWRNKYGYMQVSELKKLKQLEQENRKLKAMYAELSLRNEALKDIIEKKL